MTDIQTRKDIELLVDTFYNSVKNDSTIGYIFNDIAKVNWEEHLPTMYDFWETILLGIMSYKGNPMVKHILLSQKEELTEKHFDRWIEIWGQTIDKNFAGKKADIAKHRADIMRSIMLYKIGKSKNQNYIQ